MGHSGPWGHEGRLEGHRQREVSRQWCRLKGPKGQGQKPDVRGPTSSENQDAVRIQEKGPDLGPKSGPALPGCATWGRWLYFSRLWVPREH